MQVILRQSQPTSRAPERYPRFYHYPGCPANSEVEYLGTAWADAKAPLEALESRLEEVAGVRRLIIANEAFSPESGQLRKNSPYRNFGQNLWIENVAQVAKTHLPDTEIWLCEFRPRDLRLWSAVREYCRRVHFDGVGIQVHASLLPGIPTPFASPQNLPAMIQYQTTMLRHVGVRVAFSEVTCWSEDEYRRGEWYRLMLRVAKQERLDWLTLWSPTPADAWHWKENPPPPCWLWNEQGRWLWEDWHIEADD